MRRLLMAGAAALALLGPASADTVAQVNMTPRVVVLNPDGSQASFVPGQTQTVAGTVTANQGTAGTAPWLVQWSGQSVAVSNTVTISAASLPLPAGASTSANQSSEIAALGTTADTAYAGSGAASLIAAMKGVYAATVAPINAGSAIIGKVGIDQTTPGTTNAVGMTGIYYPAMYARTANTNGAVNIDLRGNLKTSESGSDDQYVGVAPVVAQSVTSAVGKSSAGNLYGVYALNTTATAGFVAVINATAAPAAGATIAPVECRSLPASGSVDFGYGAGPPDAYSTGIVVLISTSCTTYTAGGASFIKARVR